MTLNGVMALICVISPNAVASAAQCVKVVEDVVVKTVHVRYLISWWVPVFFAVILIQPHSC